jgi:hypothetical protein
MTCPFLETVAPTQMGRFPTQVETPPLTLSDYDGPTI